MSELIENLLVAKKIRRHWKLIHTSWTFLLWIQSRLFFQNWEINRFYHFESLLKYWFCLYQLNTENCLKCIDCWKYSMKCKENTMKRVWHVLLCVLSIQHLCVTAFTLWRDIVSWWKFYVFWDWVCVNLHCKWSSYKISKPIFVFSGFGRKNHEIFSKLFHSNFVV